LKDETDDYFIGFLGQRVSPEAVVLCIDYIKEYGVMDHPNMAFPKAPHTMKKESAEVCGPKYAANPCTPRFETQAVRME
jgi:hypothetical protein